MRSNSQLYKAYPEVTCLCLSDDGIFGMAFFVNPADFVHKFIVHLDTDNILRFDSQPAAISTLANTDDQKPKTSKLNVLYIYIYKTYLSVLLNKNIFYFILFFFSKHFFNFSFYSI